MKKIINKILERKILAGSVAALLLIGGFISYRAIFSNNGVVQYALAQVKKGTLVVSIAGSGQVSVSNQVDIQPKVSGDVVYVGVKNGQEVKAGTLIAQLDAGDAQKMVRDAEVNLESARLSLEKIGLQHEQQLRGDTLNKNYEDGLSILANLYGDFAVTLNTLDKIFFGTDLSSGQQNNINYYAQYDKKFSTVPNRLQQLYDETEKLYQQSLADYQSAERGSGEARSKAIQSGYELTTKTAEMIKTGKDVISSLQDSIIESGAVHTKQAIIDKHASDLSNYALSIDSYLKDLLALTNIINNQRDVVEIYPIDSQSQALTIKQRENALIDAKEKLADYFVRAPFAGVITKLDIEKGKRVSSATILGTLVTKQKIAEVSLNEIDIAKVKVGQKATLLFDAIPDLTINGQIAEVDAVGTVSQGVVTYGVKISFDTQDDRVKPAMSLSAEIVTDTKSDVLTVSNSAVKSQSKNHYVEIVDSIDQNIALTANVSAAQLLNPLRRQRVEVGISNDEVTEVLSGLKEGDVVVIRTLSGSQSSPAQASQSSGLFGRPRGR